MKKIWHDQAWGDYLKLQCDKKLLKKANAILKDIGRGGYEGLGKPDPPRATFQATGAAASMTTIGLFIELMARS